MTLYVKWSLYYTIFIWILFPINNFHAMSIFYTQDLYVISTWGEKVLKWKNNHNFSEL